MTRDPWEEPVEALLLDIDDTIVDTRWAMLTSCTHGAAAAWPHHPPHTHEAIATWFYDDPLGLFDAYTRGEFPFDGMRAARYHEACRRVGLPERGFDAFESTYKAVFARSQRLFDDVAPLIEAAQLAEVAIGFVTNSGQEQTDLKLDVVGLRSVGPVVTTDTLGVGKPDPAIFRHALDLLGTSPTTTVVVGDTLHSDIVGAQRTGLRAFWVQRPGLPEPRDAGWGTRVVDPSVRIVAGLGEVASSLAEPPPRRPQRDTV
ncbi:MAG: HAD family hydrolase [Mobilicoccus sp.]|nr:HAD family hydrolase [Mobilicoccus sp.]